MSLRKVAKAFEHQLYYATLYNAMPCYAVLLYAILYITMTGNAMVCHMKELSHTYTHTNLVKYTTILEPCFKSSESAHLFPPSFN